MIAHGYFDIRQRRLWPPGGISLSHASSACRCRHYFWPKPPSIRRICFMRTAINDINVTIVDYYSVPKCTPSTHAVEYFSCGKTMPPPPAYQCLIIGPVLPSAFLPANISSSQPPACCASAIERRVAFAMQAQRRFEIITPAISAMTFINGARGSSLDGRSLAADDTCRIAASIKSGAECHENFRSILSIHDALASPPDAVMQTPHAVSLDVSALRTN